MSAGYSCGLLARAAELQAPEIAQVLRWRRVDAAIRVRSRQRVRTLEEMHQDPDRIRDAHVPVIIRVHGVPAVVGPVPAPEEEVEDRDRIRDIDPLVDVRVPADEGGVE